MPTSLRPGRSATPFPESDHRDRGKVKRVDGEHRRRGSAGGRRAACGRSRGRPSSRPRRPASRPARPARPAGWPWPARARCPARSHRLQGGNDLVLGRKHPLDIDLGRDLRAHRALRRGGRGRWTGGPRRRAKHVFKVAALEQRLDRAAGRVGRRWGPAGGLPSAAPGLRSHPPSPAPPPGRRSSDSGPPCRPCVGQSPGVGYNRHSEIESAWLHSTDEDRPSRSGRESRPRAPAAGDRSSKADIRIVLLPRRVQLLLAGTAPSVARNQRPRRAGETFPDDPVRNSFRNLASRRVYPAGTSPAARQEGFLKWFLSGTARLKVPDGRLGHRGTSRMRSGAGFDVAPARGIL